MLRGGIYPPCPAVNTPAGVPYPHLVLALGEFDSLFPFVGEDFEEEEERGDDDDDDARGDDEGTLSDENVTLMLGRFAL